MKIKFTKMHGCGNDYVYIDCFDRIIDNPQKLSMILSDRRYGIGGDGIILICASDKADAKMRIFNKDGSEGKMCGNGIRCVAKYLWDSGKVKSKENISIETLSGVKTLEILSDSGNESVIKVDMGKADLNSQKIPMIFEKEKVVNEPITVNMENYNITCVSMGNPHCVIFCDEVYSTKVKEIGSKLSSYRIFPEGVNVEFVSKLDSNNLIMRVWERGSGETLACGTGACAVTVASILNDKVDGSKPVTVQLLGGDLNISWERDENLVYMTGPATTVFDGEIDLGFLGE